MLSLCFLCTVAAFFALRSSAFVPWRRGPEYRQFLSTDKLGIPNGKANQTAIHVHFMRAALKQAQNAEKQGEVPIGAVVVQHNGDKGYKILADGCNLVETSRDASAHAEMMALRRASKRVENWRLLNTTLYTTLEPCPMCLSAAQAFRVSSIVYGAPDLRLGAIETHIQLLDLAVHPFHTIDLVVPGILEDESAAQLRSFFRRRRKMNKSEMVRSLSLRQRIKQVIRKR